MNDGTSDGPDEHGRKTSASITGRTSRLLTVEELSEWVNIVVPTLYLWVHQRRIPFVKVGRLLRFERQEIEVWLQKRRVKSMHNFMTLSVSLDWEKPSW